MLFCNHTGQCSHCECEHSGPPWHRPHVTTVLASLPRRMSCTRAATSQAVCRQTLGHLPSCFPPKHSCWAPSRLQPSGGGTKAPLLTLLLAAERRLGNLGTLLASVRKGKWKKQPDQLLVAGSSFTLVVGVNETFQSLLRHVLRSCTLQALDRSRLWGPEGVTGLLASRSSHSGEGDEHVHCRQK